MSEAIANTAAISGMQEAKLNDETRAREELVTNYVVRYQMAQDMFNNSPLGSAEEELGLYKMSQLDDEYFDFPVLIQDAINIRWNR